MPAVVAFQRRRARGVRLGRVTRYLSRSRSIPVLRRAISFTRVQKARSGLIVSRTILSCLEREATIRPALLCQVPHLVVAAARQRDHGRWHHATPDTGEQGRPDGGRPAARFRLRRITGARPLVSAAGAHRSYAAGDGAGPRSLSEARGPVAGALAGPRSFLCRRRAGDASHPHRSCAIPEAPEARRRAQALARYGLGPRL